MCQGFNGLNVAYLQGTNSLASQLANCCCDIKTQIADCCCTTQRGLDAINYNMAINTNGIQQTLCNNTRDIIENQNANYRALHDEIVANRIEDKNAQIMAQQNEINALRLSASALNEGKNSLDESIALITAANEVVRFVPRSHSNMVTRSDLKRGNS